jgi:patatin-related protein
MAAQSPAVAGETRELRLGVVCYGGVSLAIYMHGQTKELNRLVKASALLENGRPAGAEGGSADVYRRLLERMAAEHPDKARTQVVVDIIAGTSAGGINGVYLAKAVANNRSQDALRNLWLEKGDISLLLRGPERLSWRWRVPFGLLRFRSQPPLRGDTMSEWLYDALAGMDRQGRAQGDPETLVPPGHLLQLFVTTTDFYGYSRNVFLTDPDPDPKTKPTAIPDRRHKHVLEFRHGDGRSDFGSADNVALAFSARATSSFPGAFPPVSFAVFENYLRKWNVRFPPEYDDKYFRLYGLSDAVPREAFFVDGGVLDNKPFGHAIAAIREKRASAEVDRRLLYLEPDPVSPVRARPMADPGTVATLLGAVSGIPRKEPVLEDLLELATFNDRVNRVRDIIEVSFERIGVRVREVLGQPLDALPANPSPRLLGDWAEKVNAAAVEDAGFGYASYIRLKIISVVDRYARAICAKFMFPDGCNQAFFVRSVMRSWADDGRLLEKASPPTTLQTEFLRDFDLEYGERRLRFVIAGLDWFYRDRAKKIPGLPERGEIDALKKRLYEAIATLRDAVAGLGDEGELSDGLSACFAEEAIAAFIKKHGFAPAEFGSRYAPELNQIRETLRKVLAERLSGFTLDLYRDLNELTARWTPEVRRDLLVRYLGFPFWDVLLFPIQELAEVGERDHVQVVRMSPRDATLLGTEGERKLSGIGRHHFGAFFERRGRENDYLWGRLDGAERLIEMLIGRDHADFEDWCKSAFEGILAEEAATNPPLPDELLSSIRTRVGKLAASGPSSRR